MQSSIWLWIFHDQEPFFDLHIAKKKLLLKVVVQK